MEVNLNEIEDFGEPNDFDLAKQVVWTSNPLFASSSAEADDNDGYGLSNDFMPTNDKYFDEKQFHGSVRSVEFETESGYSETVSVLSELSSPDPSSLSDVEDDDGDLLLEEITETMRRAAVFVNAGNEVETSAACGIGSSQILSSKGTVRGVKNRVRENIMHFMLSKQNGEPNAAKKVDTSAKDANADQGKVVIYTTSLGLVRATQYECRYVKRIFHNLMVRLDERDLFVHPHFKQELQKRLGQEVITLPQIFIDGKPVGGAMEVEKMIETGTMKDAIANVERVSHAQSCSACGGYKFISCSKCSGSGKSRRTRFSREINSLKCSACSNGMISCPECNS